MLHVHTHMFAQIP